ncbi:MAG: exodeoxyribonuclease VII large subunit [Candidatus Omnitrophica bacterium]|nr:exodeoxyribonuclease VII large subunit [Candidatus Omnitrophota bacterium]
MREYRLKSPFDEPQRQLLEEVVMERPKPRAMTVSELTHLIKGTLEQSFGSILVEGEVSEPKYHTSGHIYFTLKDDQAELKAMVWKSNAVGLRFKLEQGLKVICRGKISVYAQRGIYQLYVDAVEPKGVGELQLAFDQMMEKLEKEGLFKEERKRPLPAFPQRVGIVTSPTGAAIEDMLKVLRGHVEVLLRPVRVQGRGAAEAVAQAIRQMNRIEGLDLLIVGRGGGSLEDLWAFNEETVARAIWESQLPVISAVGHEKDLLISDLVADVRAATPTKGAEMVVARRREIFQRLAAVLEEPAFTEPQEWLKEFEERLEDLQEGMVDGLREPVVSAAGRLSVLQGDLMACSPQAMLLQQAQRIRHMQETLTTGLFHSLEQLSSRLAGFAGRLHALSPLAVLERGYSITFDEQGKAVRTAADVKPGDRIQTRLHKGRLVSRVELSEKE